MNSKNLLTKTIYVWFVLCLCCASAVESEISHCSLLTFKNTTYKFNIWVLAPFEDQQKFSKPRIQPTLQLAFDDAIQSVSQVFPENISSTIANNSEVEFYYKDTQCNADVGVKMAADVREEAILQEVQCDADADSTRNINVMLGASCDYVTGRVSALGNHWHYLTVSPGSRSSNLDLKNGTDCCSTLIRTGITETDVGNFTSKLFQRYNFTNIEVIYTGTNSHGAFVSLDLSTDCGSFIDGATDSFRENGIIEYELSYWYTDAILEDNADEVLETLRSRARVSLWCVGRRTMRKMMQAAERLGMTGGDYAFFYYDFYNTNNSYVWTDYDDHDNFNSGNKDDESLSAPHSEESLRALTLLSLRTPTSGDFASYSESLKEKISSSTNGEVVEYGEFVNPFLTFTYDAMILIVRDVIRDICNDSNAFEDGEEFSKQLRETTFESLGRNVAIGKNGDAVMDYSVLDMNYETGKFEVVMNFYGNNETFEELSPIDWPSSTVPENEPQCGFLNERCLKKDYTLFYIVGSCVGVLALFLVIIVIQCRKMHIEKKIQKKIWRVKWEDIEWARTRKISSYSGSRDSSYSLSNTSGGFNQHVTDRQKFTKTGILKGNTVAVKELKRRTVSIDKDLLVELKEIYFMEHDHICKFMGAIEEAPHVSIITEYCARGSLQDLLEDDSRGELEDVFKNSLISDVIKGMVYLHRSYFHFHGNLKSSNCLVDSRFVVKLTDFGLAKFREGCRNDSALGYKEFQNKLWTAPELLVMPDVRGTQKGDVYSFAIIVQEIVYQKGVFYIKEDFSPKDILQKLLFSSTLFRPTVEDDDDVVWNDNLKKLVRSCWAEQPEHRPAFNEIQKRFKKIFREKNLVDSLLQRLENYSLHLEDKVEERTMLYRGEKERADGLLYQMLPKGVADQLKKGDNVLPKTYESVTIFFSDIAGFTAISHGSTPMQVVQMLNDLYTMFDQIIDRFDVYKVETIGDAYMVVSGLPERNGNRHAREIARMSLSLLDGVQNKFKISHMPETQLKLRVGIHSGPVVAGVVGLKMPRYCLFGDTVNTASRMESNGKAFAIHVSPKTKMILDKFHSFQLEEREDEVFLKGLGTWKTWWLVGEDVDSDLELSASLDISSKANSTPFEFDNQVFAHENETAKTNKHVLLPDSKPKNEPKQNPIIKTQKYPRSPHLSSGKLPKSGKRHRTGVFGETVEIETIMKSGKRNQNAKAANDKLQTNQNKSTTHSPRILPKVKFAEKNGGNLTILSDEPQSGRDSGIEVGYENPGLLCNSDSETDRL